MAKSRLKLNSAGIRALLKSADMESCCRELAQGLAARDSGQRDVNTHVGKTRVNAEVRLMGADAATRRDRLI